MKRIVSVVLVFFMLASMIPLSARAEEVEAISVGDSKTITLDYWERKDYIFTPETDGKYVFYMPKGVTVMDPETGSGYSEDFSLFIIYDGLPVHEYAMNQEYTGVSCEMVAGREYTLRAANHWGAEVEITGTVFLDKLNYPDSIVLYSLNNQQNAFICGETFFLDIELPVGNIFLTGDTTWTVSDENIISLIDHGTEVAQFQANAAGTAIVTATLENGVSASITIEVEEADYSCGDNAKWSYDEATATLTISGEGAMYDFDYMTNIVPWKHLNGVYEHVVIEEGITHVGDFSFQDNYYLESVQIADSVTSIGRSAFRGIPFGDHVEDVYISENVTEIGSAAFGGPWKIKVSENNLHYSSDAEGSLYNKDKTELLHVPCTLEGTYRILDTVKSIDQNVFGVSNNLTKIEIPASVESIGDYVFGLCYSLKGIWVDPENSSFSNDSRGVLFDKAKTTLIEAPGAISGSYSIPDSVTIIKQKAFDLRTNLTSIYIPDSVKQIEPLAFFQCSGLTDITIGSKDVYIGAGAFDMCDGLKCIRFTGNAPVLRCFNEYVYSIFDEVTATAYYPEGNNTWTEEVMQNCGGNITWVPYKVYSMLADSDTAFTVGKDENAAIHVDGALSDFVSVCLDGEKVDSSNYTLTEGSTIVTFSAEYLESLSVGKHSVAIEFTDGYADVEITVSEPSPCDDGHTEESIPGKAPTCTETGLTEGKKCSVCGEIITAQQTIPALGHDFEDGSCTVCGEADPDYVEPEKPTDPVEPEDPALDGVIRIAGDDRIATSLMLAAQLKEVLGVEKFDAVVVASALNFPDALTGSYLAAEKNAPILLTYPAAHAKIRAYIQENLKPGGMVYILGGEGAVSADFADGLNGFNVKRLAGSDRFGTNLAIMEEAGVNADQPVLIATAVNFADSLSASAAGLPMVLVYGSLREDQKEFLATTSKNFIIIGGEAAVSKSLENELAAIGSVTRVAGSSRYETSVLVAERFVQNPDAVILAYAKNFPDGLCGGPLAYALGAPLILTDNSGYSTADTYVSGISAGIVVGGAGLISDETANQIFDK